MRKRPWGVIKCQKIPDNPNYSLKTEKIYVKRINVSKFGVP